MNKNTLLTLLLISAICQLVNAVAGWALLNLGGLAAAILSLIIILNAKQILGPESVNAYNSSLWTMIVNGAVFLLGSTLGVFLAIFTLGLGLLLSGGIVFLADIGLGIWQLVVWNKLRNGQSRPAAAV